MKRNDPTPTTPPEHSHDGPIPKVRGIANRATAAAAEPAGTIRHLALELLNPHPAHRKLYEYRDDPDFDRSIAADGIRVPLVVTSDNVIISGCRRWRAAKKTGHPTVKVQVQDFANPILAIIDFNRQRQKTRLERAREAKAYHEELAKLAKERQRAAGVHGVKGKEFGKLGAARVKGPLRPTGGTRPGTRDHAAAKKRKTIVQEAEIAQMDPKTLSKIYHIEESTIAPPELKAKLADESVPVATVYREVKKLEAIKARQEARSEVPVPKNPFKPEIHHGNCLEVMSDMDDESVRVIFTDSPYGISGGERMTMKGAEVVNLKNGDWDEMSPQKYRFLMSGFLKQSYRVLDRRGALYCFCDRLFIGELWAMAKEVGFSPKNVLTWVKTNPTVNTRKNFFSATEVFLFAVKTNDYVWNSREAPEMHNVIVMPKSTGGDRADFPHPTQKPVALAERYIEISSNPGDVILDPFSGSGSFGVAAWKLKRRSILIEEKVEHFKTIKERIALLGEQK